MRACFVRKAAFRRAPHGRSWQYHIEEEGWHAYHFADAADTQQTMQNAAAFTLDKVSARHTSIPFVLQPRFYYT